MVDIWGRSRAKKRDDKKTDIDLKEVTKKIIYKKFQRSFYEKYITVETNNKRNWNY